MSATPVTAVTGAVIFDGARMLLAGIDFIIAADPIAGVESGPPPPGSPRSQAYPDLGIYRYT